MRKDELLEIIKVKNKEIERQDKVIREINKTKYDKLMEKDILFHLKNRNEELEAKLAESEKKLNQYPYKNDVIEKQYEDLKEGIKFRIKNNITDDWEQHYNCIDVLCEKHKSRIRDIENGICKIEQLEQQLAKKEIDLSLARNEINTLKTNLNIAQEHDNIVCKQLFEKCKESNQDKISFAVDILEELADCSNYINSKLDFECGSYVSEKAIRDKIKYLKGKKDE